MAKVGENSYAQVCSRIQSITGRDIGSRGMIHLVVPGDLERAGALFAAATSTIILTGFPCRLASVPPTETDGPSGAAALALGAHRLGARTCIAVDASSSSVLSACASAVGLTSSSLPPFACEAFPSRTDWGQGDTERMCAAIQQYGHSIAVERAGVSKDGTYRTMRCRVMDEFIAPLDVLLTAGTGAGAGAPVQPSMHATAHEAAAFLVPGQAHPSLLTMTSWPARTSTGIGDGGNEAGMGKVSDAVRAHIDNGEVIACVTPADALVAAGVSNWGAWAVLAAAEAALRCAGRGGTGSHTFPRAAVEYVHAHPPGCCLPSLEEEKALSDAMMNSGAGDGISGACDGSVDGMPLSTHLEVLTRVRGVLQEEFGGEETG